MKILFVEVSLAHKMVLELFFYTFLHIFQNDNVKIKDAKNFGI